MYMHISKFPDQTKHLPESERDRFVAGISLISRWSSERGDLEALSLLPCKMDIEGHRVSTYYVVQQSGSWAGVGVVWWMRIDTHGFGF